MQHGRCKRKPDPAKPLTGMLDAIGPAFWVLVIGVGLHAGYYGIKLIPENWRNRRQ